LWIQLPPVERYLAAAALSHQSTLGGNNGKICHIKTTEFGAEIRFFTKAFLILLIAVLAPVMLANAQKAGGRIRPIGKRTGGAYWQYAI
jgi:hypothetical protein